MSSLIVRTLPPHDASGTRHCSQRESQIAAACQHEGDTRGIRGPYEARHCRRAIGRQAPGRFELLGWPDKSFLILLKHPNSLGAHENGTRRPE
jgi:hypothetical protein